jgi:hypothetical protein
MLSHSLVNGVRTWTSPNGELQLLTPAPHVLVTKFQGALYDEEFVQHVLDATEQIAVTQQRPFIFHDWEGMQLYVTEARTRMTDQAVELSPRVEAFSVLLGSKMVRMGVSMASLRMGGVIQMHTSRIDFEQSVREAVASRQPGRLVR